MWSGLNTISSSTGSEGQLVLWRCSGVRVAIYLLDGTQTDTGGVVGCVGMCLVSSTS